MSNPEVTTKQKVFDRWAPSYDWLFPSVFYQAIHQRLLEFVQLCDRPQVLDLGCGTGRLLNRLAAQFPDLWGTGLDLAPEMLRQARQRNQHHPRLIYVQGNAEALPFAEEQFDAVFNTLSFLHYPNPTAVLAEVQRVLRPDGRFYWVDLVPWKQATSSFALPSVIGRMRFYSPDVRQHLGDQTGFNCLGHQYLLGPVMLTIFAKPTE